MEDLEDTQYFDDYWSEAPGTLSQQSKGFGLPWGRLWLPQQ